MKAKQWAIGNGQWAITQLNNKTIQQLTNKNKTKS